MQDLDETPAETRPEIIPETSRYTTITVAEAAQRLGVTEDAVRKRLQRGSLEGIKTGGTWDVVETHDLKRETPSGTDETQDIVSGRRENVPVTSDSVLVKHLQEEVEYLRDQLATTIQQLAAERERADVLQREALDRIVALTATIGDAVGSSETNEQRDEGARVAAEETAAPGARGDLLERLSRWLRGK